MRNLIEKLGQFRFLSVSLLLHMGLVVLIGTVIITKNSVPDTAFEVSQGGFLEEVPLDSTLDSPSDSSAEFQEEMEQAAVEPASPANSGIAETTSQLITSTAASSYQTVSSDFVSRGDTLVSRGMPGGLARSIGSGAGQGSGKLDGGLFGTREARQDALPGIFFDLKQTPAGAATEVGDLASYWRTVRGFCEAGFDDSQLAGFFRAPLPLYASQWTFPNVSASAAPAAFSVQDRVKPQFWLAHYRGKISATTPGSIRFSGYGDNLLIVAIDGRIVLDASRSDGEKSSSWSPNKKPGGPLLSGNIIFGDSVEFRPGQARQIDIVIGESGGGLFGAYLLIQDHGKSGPFPFFATAPGKLPDGVGEALVDKSSLIFNVN